MGYFQRCGTGYEFEGQKVNKGCFLTAHFTKTIVAAGIPFHSKVKMWKEFVKNYIIKIISR